MNGDFPDVVPAGRRAPSRFFRGDAAQGPAKARSMPGVTAVRLIKHLYESLNLPLCHANLLNGHRRHSDSKGD
jgi:hypothetical protein